MRTLSMLLLALALAGCKGSREKDVVGTWKSSVKSIVATSDKGYVIDAGQVITRGKWSVEGDDVTFTPKTLNGTPMATIKQRLQAKASQLSPALRKVLVDLDKPNVLTLSSDGRTLTTNKAKDTNVEGWQPLTKG